MTTYEDAEVPFVVIGNRRGLTHTQVADDPWLTDFYQRFKHRFEVAQEVDAVLLIEDAPHATTETE